MNTKSWITAALLSLVAWPAWGQGLPNQGFGVPNTPPAIAGTGTVGDTVVVGPGKNQLQDVRTFNGIDCSGATDSTTALQSAVNTYPRLFIPMNCTLIIDNLSFAISSTIIGEGPTSILFHKNSATTHFMTQNNSGGYVELRHLTVDGNYLNNGGDNVNTKSSLVVRAGGLSATQLSYVILDDVTFTNGDDADIWFTYTNGAYPTVLMETNVRHLGGAYGGSAAAINGYTYAFLDNILMNLQRVPSSGSTATGRAGYVFERNDVTDTSTRSVTANNVQCYNIGTTIVNTLGCLDSYSGGDNFIVTNSFTKGGFGRGFTTKASVKKIIFSNIVGSDLAQNTDVSNTTGDVVGVYGGVPSDTSTGYDILVNNVVCRNSTAPSACFTFEFQNQAINAALSNVVISNLIVDGCGARGVRIKNPFNVRGNNWVISGCDTVPLQVLDDAGVTQGPLDISDVMLNSAVVPSFSTRVKANLWYSHNRQSTVFAASDLTVAVASNTITAWNPIALVDTSGGAQTVSTINNVPDGSEITIMAASAAFPLTVQSGGNLSIAGPVAFIIQDLVSSITLKSIHGTLYEIGRSTPTLNKFLNPSTSSLSLQFPDGTAAGGNARGNNAIDLQTSRTTAGQVASANLSIAIGDHNTATGTNSIAIGTNNSSSGNTGITMGDNNIASGVDGFSSGTRANDRSLYGFWARSSGRFALSGDAQAGLGILRCTVASSGGTCVLTADQGAAGAANCINIPNNAAYTVRISLVAIDHVTPANNWSWVVPNGLLTRGASAAATAWTGGTPVTVTNGTATAIAAAAAADTTNGCLQITFTHPTGTTNAWNVVARIDTTETQ